MIAKHEKIFRNNIISYIFNRLDLVEKDSLLAEEVMNRFPVWTGFTGSNKEDQRQLIVFLIYGMRQMLRMNKE